MAAGPGITAIATLAEGPGHRDGGNLPVQPARARREATRASRGPAPTEDRTGPSHLRRSGSLEVVQERREAAKRQRAAAMRRRAVKARGWAAVSLLWVPLGGGGATAGGGSAAAEGKRRRGSRRPLVVGGRVSPPQYQARVAPSSHRRRYHISFFIKSNSLLFRATRDSRLSATRRLGQR